MHGKVFELPQFGNSAEVIDTLGIEMADAVVVNGLVSVSEGQVSLCCLE